MSRKLYIHDMYLSYRETLLWSETDDDGEPLDGQHDETDFSYHAKMEILKDIRDFVGANWGLLQHIDPGQAGHDFVLSRNGHGTGFWDRGNGETSDSLHKAAKACGTMNLYVDDNNELSVA